MGFLVVDSGTTNMRVRYVERCDVIASVHLKANVSKTVSEGQNTRLKQALKLGIGNCLDLVGVCPEEVEAVFASGMITSNLGILEIPHIQAPVGFEEIRAHIVTRIFPEIIACPIHFVPGVKTCLYPKRTKDIQTFDMMRGEETEALGAAFLLEQAHSFIFLSPGSHTKYVEINEEKQIVRSLTTLTGELLSAISRHTVLSDSLPEQMIQTIDKDYIDQGVKDAECYGITKACFSIRIMDKLGNSSANARMNYLAGALIYNDILAFRQIFSEKSPIVIGGKKILQEIYAYILTQKGWESSSVYVLSDSEKEISAILLAKALLDQMKNEIDRMPD